MKYIYLYHIYLISMGLLLPYFSGRSIEYVFMCNALLYFMLCWFQVSAYMTVGPMAFDTGAYCPLCKRVTSMGLRHCKFCGICVPEKFLHCKILNKCVDKKMRYRWITLFKIICVYHLCINLCTMFYSWYLIPLIPLHSIVLKSIYNNSRGINIA